MDEFIKLLPSTVVLERAERIKTIWLPFSFTSPSWRKIVFSSGKYRNLSPQTNGKLWFIKVTERKFNLFFILSKEKVISLLGYPWTSSQKWDDICRLSSLSTLVPVPTFSCGNQVIREKQTHPELCLQKPFLCADKTTEFLPRRLH